MEEKHEFNRKRNDSLARVKLGTRKNLLNVECRSGLNYVQLFLVLVFCTGCIFQQQWSKITLTAVGVDALHAAGFEASDVVTTTFLHPSSRQHKLAFKRDGDHAILFPPRTS